MKKLHITLLLFLIISITAILFIDFSNDHKECTTKTKISNDKQGNQVKELVHHCNEKYNF
jgi:hypothetical protein